MPDEPAHQNEGSPYWRGKPCPKCGQPNEEDAPYCQYCGRLLAVKRAEKRHLLATSLFYFVGLPAFAVGTCALLSIPPQNREYKEIVSPIATALVVLAYAVFLILFLAAWGKPLKKWVRRMWGKDSDAH